MGVTQQIGTFGENAAANWLDDKGFSVVARNWRQGRYEIDIVATKNRSIHFVEVKTRAEESWEEPEQTLDATKQRAFMRAAAAYLADNPTDLEPQLDLIAIDTSDGKITEIRYVPHAVIPRW